MKYFQGKLIEVPKGAVLLYRRGRLVKIVLPKKYEKARP